MADLLIAGNKLDLKKQRCVTIEDARSFSHKNEAVYVETSAFECLGSICYVQYIIFLRIYLACSISNGTLNSMC